LIFSWTHFYERLHSKFFSKTRLTLWTLERIVIFMKIFLFCLSTIQEKWNVTNCKLQVIIYNSQVTSCKLQVTSYKLQVTSLSYNLQVTSYILQVTSYKLQFTIYKLQFKIHKLQVSSFSVQLFWHFKHWNGLTLLCTVLAGTVKLKLRVNFEWQSLLVACTLLMLG
jgi:hypothetical protein